MTLLQQSFAELRAGRKCGFVPFIVAGDPDLHTTSALLIALSRLRPVAIEVGVPFSDPTADGAIIQRAAQRALLQHTTLEKTLQMLARTRPNESVPIVLFSYFNPILQFGLAPFARRAARHRVAGVLVVDLPAEAAMPLRRQLRRYGIDLIFLVAPTTSDRRLHQITRMASGFIYAVARTGVTGTATKQSDEWQALVARLRAVTDLPVAVGFGITTRRQAQQVCRYADAAVVGSRLVAEIEKVTTRKGFDRSRVVRAVTQCARQFV